MSTLESIGPLIFVFVLLYNQVFEILKLSCLIYGRKKKKKKPNRHTKEEYFDKRVLRRTYFNQKGETYILFPVAYI